MILIFALFNPSWLVSGWAHQLVLEALKVSAGAIVLWATWTKYIFIPISRYKHQSRSSCRHYYIYGTKKKQQQIANKHVQPPAHWLQQWTSTVKNKRKTTMPPFDSDSFEIAIDNCASANFTNNLSDYVSKERTTAIVRGVGTQQISYIGTVKWNIQDD